MPFDLEDMADSLSIDEFAELLHVHRTTAERIIRDGEVDVIRIGHGRGRLRVPRRSATDYINRMHQKRKAV